MPRIKQAAQEMLNDVILPFWMSLKDPVHGGFYGLVDFVLRVDKTAEKGCILNSRILWFFSEAAMLTGRQDLADCARHAYRFFEEHCYDRENGEMVQSFSIPQPGERGYGEDVYYLLVVGEDIENLTTGGYVTGGTDPDTPTLEGCGVTVERYESSLDAMLREILEPYWAERQWEDAYGVPLWKVDFETWYRAFLEYLLSHGLLSPHTAERYGSGWLEDIAGDVNVVDRVCWLEAQVTIPAGGIVEFTAAMTKEASCDFACAHTENRGVKGYDLVTELGSNLTCTAQTATLADRGQIEIVRQNFGFDLENGVNTVPLDLSTEHYYLEVRRAAG